MTEIATTHADDGSFGVVAGDSPRADRVPLPRFTLRKRKANMNAERGAPVCLPSVNSALLSNLFADVAEIQQPKNADEESLPTLGGSPPTKKSRASLTHSISRSPKSFKCLADALFPSANHLPSTQVPENASPLGDLTRQVTPESSPSPKVISVSKVLEACTQVPSISAKPSFPHLPPAVSNSSLTRVNSNLSESDLEKEEKECYGWFIEMEEEGAEDKEQINPYHKSASSNNLAFVAPTAPKAEDHDAEVEWAKAADTVDSVLGDFF